MKIYGDAASTRFKTYVQEAGTICGHNDVLVGDRQTVRRMTASFFGQEYLRIPSQNGRHQNRITHPLGEWAGSHTELNNPDDLCHMHRIRGVFSLLKYHLLKNLSSEWEEVAIQAGQVSENVLIERNNRTNISRAGLIHQN